MQQHQTAKRIVAVVAALAAAGVAVSQGQVVGWGLSNGVPQPAIPSMLRYTQVAAGAGVTYALRSDGTITAFLASSGILQNLSGVQQIAAGVNHAYALRVDGSLVGEGYPYSGQLATPANVGAVAQVACGLDYTLALRVDGTVLGWGRNWYGETSIPSGLSDVRQIACNSYHAYALKRDGTAVGWGRGDPWGQTSTPIGLSGVSQIACGENHNYALRNDGSLVGWGCPLLLNEPAGLAGVTQIACGQGHTYALKSDGTLVGWQQAGQTGYGETDTPASATDDVVQVACGSNHTVAVKRDGSIVAWGMNGAGQTSVPVAHEGLTDVSCGAQHAYGLRADGTVTGWGSNLYAQTDTPAGAVGVAQIQCGGWHTYALKYDGELVGWGGVYNPGTGHAVDWGQVSTPAGLGPVLRVACGSYHTYALKNDGAVQGWGRNTSGQVDTPASAVDVIQMACGDQHSYALRQDGSLVGWGSNTYGQISTPANAVAVDQVACGEGYTCALRSDGTVLCWGDSRFGVLDVPTGLNGVEIACGARHTYAIQEDGSLVGWGWNPYGETATPSDIGGVVRIACGFGTTLALLNAESSGCSNSGGAGTATIQVSGCAWQRAGAWAWSNGAGPQVPGALTAVDFGTFGSVGSECYARASTLTARPGTSLLVSPAASTPGNDYSIRVEDTANLAGRLWLLGVDGAGSTLPESLNLSVLSAGTVNGTFDLIQSELPPPAGFFLTLVPEDFNGRTVLSLRLLPLPGNAELSGANAGTFAGTAVAAETIDINHDGFDDLALAVDFGAGQNGLIQILLNDGAGNLGGTSVLCQVPPQPTCLAVGDVNLDGREDVVVGIASDQSARVYLDNGQGALTAGTVMASVGGTPKAVVVIPPSGASMAPASSSVGVGITGSKLKIFLNGALQQELTMAGTIETVKGGDTGGRSGTDIVTGGRKSASFGMLPAAETGFVQVLRRQSNGLYAIVQTMSLTAEPVGMDVEDLDGDGLDDIVTANANPLLPAAGSALPVLSIFRNSGGTFGGGVPYQPSGASSGLSVSLIDADNDGDRDIVSVHRKIGTDSEAALLRVDTLGAGTPISIGQTTVLDADSPILSARGNLDGIGGDDLYLVDNGGGNFLTGAKVAKPYLAVGGARQGDLDGDGIVGTSDVALLLLDFGPCPGCVSDLDGTGEVDTGDLAFLLLLFD